MAGKKKQDQTINRPEEHPLYHNTWKLLQTYRDAVWNLELAIQQVRVGFESEFGESIEDFIESLYLAGADFSGTQIERHARSIERSRKMLRILDSAVELLRNKHKNGESFYWILYYSFLSPQELECVEDVLERLKPHIHNISYRTYYRRRQEAIEALSTVLWGYTSKECIDILERFFPEDVVT